MSKTFLCISCEFKGHDFYKACKAAGNKVFLVTNKNLENKPWNRANLDDIFFVEEKNNRAWDIAKLKKGLAYFMRSNKVDRIIALDDFDVEKAAALREHFRVPGMGETTSRYFRDKLAMRVKAQNAGLKVPPFSALFTDDEVNQFIADVPAPWVVKPRADASAAGIQKVKNGHELWEAIHRLGDERDNYLVEQFKPGTVYHVDALIKNEKIIFVRTSKYLSTPFEVAHGGGIFRSVIVEFGSKEDKALQKMNKEVLQIFGMKMGASHTEFIQSDEDGEFYFLETSSRVGGAHLAEMVEYSSGINLWGEWAKLESAESKAETYKLPKVKKAYTGIVVSLSKFQQPDYASFTDSEIVWRLNKEYHIGMIIQAKTRKRVLELLDQYAVKINKEFHASV